MWRLGSALVLLQVLPYIVMLDVSVLFQRGSGGQGVLINVDPKEKIFLGTLCGYYDSYKLCSNETFSGNLRFSNLYPYTDYNLTLSDAGTQESIAFRTDFGVPFSAVNYSSVKVSSRSIDLTWYPQYPEVLHGPPSGYRAVICEYFSIKSCTMLNFTTNRGKFVDLAPLMRYNITIWPYNVDSFGDVLDNSRLANTLIVRTAAAPVSFVVPIVLASAVLILVSGLLLCILKQRLFSSSPKHFLLIEEDFSL